MINRVQALLLALLLPVAAPAFAPADAAASTDSTSAGEGVRLPASVTPRTYRIDFTPDIQALTFRGTAQIDITVHQPTKNIVLNSADLVIDRAGVLGHGDVRTIRYDTQEQTATLTLDRELSPGAYTLSLAYRGKIYRQASGLFVLDYDTPSGKARALFTQFENSDARRFVPSWDEPGRKAVFELTATVPSNQLAFSNMPVASTGLLGGGLKRVRFAPTPRMSSYLLFFGMGDFERVHRNVDGVDVGVLVKRGDTASGAFALDAAARILPYYNRYFDTPYPLPKLDLIGAPGTSQFFGAMENWGAIFYFERDLLIDPRISTESDKQNVYLVVAHEMAHQWFGDLVTMAWWDDLWLNEGFASWMENKVTDHFHPEWKIWLQAQREKQAAMQEDARDGTHPIITPILDVTQASSAFDTITYSKGAAVIHMLESYLGEDAFRAGVRRYIHDFAYGNTVTDDLWHEMDKGSRRPIMRIAHDFTLQAGVPMLSQASDECAGGKSRLRIAQGHFAIDADSTSARIWHVPALIAPLQGRRSVATVVSGAVGQAVAVSGCGAVLLNAGQTGYFRAHYSDDGLAAIVGAFRELSPEDQLGVLNDRSALAYAGQEPMTSLLELVKKFPADAEPVVASALVELLRGLDRIYDGLPAQTRFRSYATGVLQPIFDGVGWDRSPREGANVPLLRSHLIAALGDFGDPPVLAEARQRFDRYAKEAATLDAGARRTVLGIIAAHADAVTWDELHRMAQAAATEMERRELYVLLAVPANEVLVQRALDLAISGEPPATIAPEMISAASERHPKLAFEFAIAHWDRIAPLIEPSSQARYVPSLLNDATDLNLIGELEHFAEGHIPPDDRQELRKAAANVRYLAMVRDDRLPEIDRWIKTDGGRVSTVDRSMSEGSPARRDLAYTSQTGDHGDDLAAE
jgi:aminopeptidase N